MKSHLTKLSLALLSTVFLLGCQEQASSPVGLEGLGPQFAKKNCKGTDHPPPCGGGGETEEGTFTATFTVDVTGGAGLLDNGKGELSGPHSGKQNLGGGGVHRDPIPLTFTNPIFLKKALGYNEDEGGRCFGSGASPGVFTGIMDIHKETPNSNVAKISYWFTGKDKRNGTTDVNYSLSLSGVLIPAEWPPTLTKPTTINGSEGTFMVGNNNSPAELACRGTGSVKFSVVVERIT